MRTPNTIGAPKGISNKYLLLIDQTLLSVVNFGSVLLLSRIAPVDVFGSFVVTYSYGYFIFIFCTLLLSAPILIFLKKKWQQQEGTYLISTLLLNIVLCIVLGLVAYFFLKTQISDISFLHFLALPLGMTLFDITKKFVFSSDAVHVKYGLLATILLNISFFGLLLYLMYGIDLDQVLEVYGISFMLAALVLMVIIFSTQTVRRSIKTTSVSIVQFTKKMIRTHFTYAKWIILGGVAFWGYNQGIYILAKSFHVDDLIIGKVRTIQNLVGVFNILMITLENHYTPIFSKHLSVENNTGLKQRIKNVYAENYIKVLSLFVLAVPFGLGFYHFVYLEKYGSGTIIFVMFLLVQLLLVAIKPISIALKSIEKTIPFFVSHLFAVTVMVGVFPILLYAKNGYTLALTFLMANVTYAIYILVYYLKKKKSSNVL